MPAYNPTQLDNFGGTGAQNAFNAKRLVGARAPAPGDSPYGGGGYNQNQLGSMAYGGSRAGGGAPGVGAPGLDYNQGMMGGVGQYGANVPGMVNGQPGYNPPKPVTTPPPMTPQTVDKTGWKFTGYDADNKAMFGPPPTPEQKAAQEASQKSWQDFTANLGTAYKDRGALVGSRNGQTVQYDPKTGEQRVLDTGKGTAGDWTPFDRAGAPDWLTTEQAIADQNAGVKGYDETFQGPDAIKAGKTYEQLVAYYEDSNKLAKKKGWAQVDAKANARSDLIKKAPVEPKSEASKKYDAWYDGQFGGGPIQGGFGYA